MKTTRGIDLIVVPYDSGRRGWRMGAGTLRLLERGLPDRLRALGFDVRVTQIELPGATRDAADAAHGESHGQVDQLDAFPLAADLAASVSRSRDDGRFPLILAGNCISSLGTVSGVGAARTGVVWFDAHGDFNTPETSASGFLDGMSLAILTGRCHANEAGGVPGFAPLAEDAAVLVGARELDEAEARLLRASGVRMVAPGAATPEEIAAALEAWPDGLAQAYLHVDLDVLDASEALVNEYSAAGGLTLPDLLTCIDAVATHMPLAAAALTALDPDADPDGRALAAGVAVVEQIAMRAAGARA